MPMAHVRKIGGENDLYHIAWLDQRTDPGYGHGGGFHPDQGLPGHGHPDQGLPGGGHISNTLPGGGHISNRPPGSRPNFPDHTLPEGPPPHVGTGTTLIMVRDPQGVWHYAAIQPGQPVPPPIIDNTLPGGPPPLPGQPLPPTAQPKR